VKYWARRGTVVLGAVTAVSLAVLVVLGLFVSDPDYQQGDAVRLMYLHVPAAWVAYLAYGVTSLASTSGSAPGPRPGTRWPAPRPRSACCSPA